MKMISLHLYGSGLSLTGVSSKQETTLFTPLDFSPLFQLTNRIVAGLNELRQCTAIGVSALLHHQLVVVMEFVIHQMCEYHRSIYIIPVVLYMLSLPYLFDAHTKIPIAAVKLIPYFSGTSEKVVIVILLAKTI